MSLAGSIIIGIVAAVAAVGFLAWIVSAMITHRCPSCMREGSDEMMIPIIPAYRWLCLNCGKTCPGSETIRRNASDS